MAYREAEDILAEAKRRGLRRALVLTALNLEMEAVRGHLVDLGACVGRDGTVYECGVFSDVGQDWLVIVAETGAGTHPAQSVVTYAHHHFGEFEVQLLVGVGGSRKTDVPVGSVVASDHVYMPYSGKYGEHGRSGRPRTFPVDGRLLGLARKVRRDGLWPARIRGPHKGKLPEASAYPTALPPIATVAPIVSVEAVSADPKSELEALIARECGDACVVEMEGYGAVYAASQERTPSILIRGVSDMAEKKEPGTDAILQPIAACHAAAFAFELLTHWGQVYRRTERSEAKEADVGPLPLAMDPERGTSSTAASAEVGPNSMSAIVINLDADAISAEQLAAVQDALRQSTGSPDIRIVRTERGSLRIVVEVPPEALASLNAKNLGDVLKTTVDAKLLGVVGEKEYDELKALQAQLIPASQNVLAWPKTLPRGEKIERSELTELLARIDNSATSTTALLGAPGAGKSALLSTLVGVLVERGWPVLAIKADLLDPAVESEADLQAALGIAASPRNAIERLAKLRPVVLVIDQLDALAKYLDVRTGRLSVLLNLVRHLGGIENVHIVLSSRTFEYEHDVRLKTIAAESLTLALPAWSQVATLLEANGVKAEGWPPDAQELVRSPHALATYIKLGDKAGTEPFGTYQAMLERLWDERVLVGPNGARRAELVGNIAERMAEEESLWLAKARFDTQLEDINALVASGVLTLDSSGGSLGFAHQTIFDFALARSFTRGKGQLSQYVLSRQASLFLRPKLWSALAYLRAVERSTYEAELEAIWTGQNLRRHLRLLLIDFVGQQSEPTDREALLLERALRNLSERALAFRALTGSPGWFARFADSFISEAMADKEAAHLAVGVLSSAWFFAQDRVEELISRNWSSNAANDRAAWTTIERAPKWSDATLALAVRIVRRTDIAPFAIDHLVSELGAEQPAVALDLVRARLDRELELAISASKERAKIPKPPSEPHDAFMAWYFKHNPKDPVEKLLKDDRQWNSLPTLAENEPELFLEKLWPWYLAVFSALKRLEGPELDESRYHLLYDADFRFEQERVNDLRELTLLSALRLAVEEIAKREGDTFLQWMNTQLTSDLAPVHRIIAHALALHPDRFSTVAFDYLVADPRRFRLGASNDSSSTTKRLVLVASAHWPETLVQRFAKFVEDYAPPLPPDLTDAKQKAARRRGVRRIQLDLLRSLPTHRTSKRTQLRIAQEARVFPDGTTAARFSGVRWIGSVMEPDDIAKASDDDVLNAFKVLPDQTGWDHPTNWEVGGNIQLSRAFATFAKDHPNRARALIARFQPEFGERATGYALDALAETDDPAAIVALLLDAANRGFGGEEFRSSACSAIGRLIGRKQAIGDDVVDLLERWLAQPVPLDDGQDEGALEGSSDEDADPIDAESEDDKDEDLGDRSLLWDQDGFAIVPGGDYPVLEVLVRALLTRNEPDRLVDSLFAHLARSRDVKLWQHMLHLLVHLQPDARSRREEFLTRLFDEVPQLLGTRDAAYLLGHVHWWAPGFVEKQMERWSKLEGKVFQQGYGELVGLVAILQPTLTWSQTAIDAIQRDDSLVDSRAGAAFSAIHLWVNAAHRALATRMLTRLLERNERGVWVAIFDLFRIIDGLAPEANTIAILEAIATNISHAPRLSTTFVIERLQTLLPHEGLLVGKIAEGLIDVWRGELADLRTATALASPELMDLAITLHRLGPATREQGTTLLEKLLELDAYSAREMLDEIDNRFRPQQSPRRRRLARRSPRRTAA